MMNIQQLPNELLVHVFQSCSSVVDVLNLASTCRHFRYLCRGSQKLQFLFEAAAAEFGPLKDAIQLVTHNESQPAHIRRHVRLSLSLLQQILVVGRVAKKWEELYPFKKWKYNFEDRRLLTSLERYYLRRAIYRLWLYDRAFHNDRYLRLSRMFRPVILKRTHLLHNWTTVELAQIEDVRMMIQKTLEDDICPSNRAVRLQLGELSQDLHYHRQDLRLAPGRSRVGRHFQRSLVPPHDEPGSEGWGDDIAHYYVVEDMMKLDPGQIMWLKEHGTDKRFVQAFVDRLGDWFPNNGQTFCETLDLVLCNRGGSLSELKDSIALGEEGLALGPPWVDWHRANELLRSVSSTRANYWFP